jgi:hypothetical protein
MIKLPAVKNNSLPHLILASVGLAALSQALLADSFLKNPSFESNYNDTWPHYGSIDEWNGGSGVNDDTGPFHNAGTAIPESTASDKAPRLRSDENKKTPPLVERRLPEAGEIPSLKTFRWTRGR